MNRDTICVHGNKKPIPDKSGAVAVPIYQTATFAHPAVGKSTGYDYTRSGNPTRDALESAVASLEGGADALAFASGMAAVTTLMELFAPNDHIIASDDLYGGTRRLFDAVSVKNGLQFTYVGGADELSDALTEHTRAVFIETPTNPMMNVVDIAQCAAFSRAHGLLLIVDNTFLTPYFQQPIALGADIVLHSGTKYLGGHNDTLAGLLVTKTTELAEKLRFIQKTTGAVLAPFDAFLVLRGIKTLALRVTRQQETAVKVAEWLQSQRKVARVYYPGLPEHPQYELSRRQASGFGGMLSFTVDSRETAERVLEAVQLIQYAESLGGVESLITYPMLQTHADVPEAERLRLGIDDKLLRLSVGIEDADDLIADLAQAFGG
ncbi:MAG: PLP-dependent aspartate aminotransferase family protein [Oscillospiraceae bacterium]|jgi:cystathionine gamma-synthase|nr:PLP-dependent aspartate aminotransferase family protein [Oscillospiraceae bacterium]